MIDKPALLFEMCQSVKDQIGEDMLERLVNVADMHGDTVAMRVISKLQFTQIS
jgi:hypothetical protein